MKPVTVLQIILAIMTLFWLVAGWMRLRRYVYSLERVEYSQRRYGQWYWANRAERLYLVGWLSVLTLLYTVACCLLLTQLLNLIFVGFLVLAIFLIPNETLILLTLIPAILSIMALALAPRDGEVTPPLPLTRRATRILVTAGIIETLPLFPALWGLTYLFRPTGLAYQANYSMTNFSIWILLCLFTGPIAFFLTPLIVAVANLLNWPIDRAKGQQS
jgi:hypothetical protein